MSSSMLDIGLSGILTSKEAMENSAHNIANANTKGYTRKVVTQKSIAPGSHHRSRVGQGAEIIGIKRITDNFLEKRLLSTNSEHGFHEEKAEVIKNIESVLGSDIEKTFNATLNKFYNDFRSLANEPESSAQKEIVRQSAINLANQIRTTRNSLDDIEGYIDNRMSFYVEDVNNTLKSIANLNKSISYHVASNRPESVHEQKDERNLHLQKLAKYFDIHQYTDNQGNHIISASNVGTLIHGSHINELIFEKGQADHGDTNIDISFKKINSNLLKRFKKGEFSALRDVRSGVLKNLKNNLDEIAYGLSNSVNEIHKKGYNILGKESAKQTGFFEDLKDIRNASRIFDVSNSIKEDSENIATALSANSPGDNRIALQISSLQNKKILDDGQASINEKFISTIGSLGALTERVNLEAEQSRGLVNQAETLRENISGVSVDEEATQIMKFQNYFNASSKIIQVAEKMLDTIINLKK